MTSVSRPSRLRVDTAGRLVEQDQPWLEHQHLGQLDELLLAVGQRAGTLRAKRRSPTMSSSSPARSASWPLTASANIVRHRASGSGATTFSSTVMLVEQPRESGRSGPGRGGRAARAASGRSACRRSQTSPESADMPPVTRLKSVVLPEPFGPISAVMDALADGKARAVDRDQTAEPLGRAPNLQQRPVSRVTLPSTRLGDDRVPEPGRAPWRRLPAPSAPAWSVNSTLDAGAAVRHHASTVGSSPAGMNSTTATRAAPNSSTRSGCRRRIPSRPRRRCWTMKAPTTGP